jgi:putative CocE/NonD family hydrolase
VRTPNDNGVAAQVRRREVVGRTRLYAYVVQDVRGRGESDGEFYPLVHEAEDGDDTIRWCGTQAWSNGKVGMTGSSYLGWTQLYPAGMKNPSLAALCSRSWRHPIRIGIFRCSWECSARRRFSCS